MDNTYNEKIVFFEISRKFVFFEIFLYWFKCTKCNLYGMIFFPKNTTGNASCLLYPRNCRLAFVQKWHFSIFKRFLLTF